MSIERITLYARRVCTYFIKIMYIFIAAIGGGRRPIVASRIKYIKLFYVRVRKIFESRSADRVDVSRSRRSDDN